MAKISNPKSFSEIFGIDKKVLDSLGIFDPVINVDSRLFIDPLLLEKSAHKEFNTAALRKYNENYSNILSLLQMSKNENDKAWRSAKLLIHKKELDGTCLGYGINSTSGRSLPEELIQDILKTAKEIVDIGIIKPELFVLLPLFEEGIGPDTISDLTAGSIRESIFDFTKRISKELGIKTRISIYEGEMVDIIQNPLKKKVSPILLLPKDILRHLPFASSWDDIGEVSSFNISLRKRINKYIGELWQARTKKEKEKAKRKIINNPDAINVLLEVIKESKVDSYDFIKDQNGVMQWRNLLSSVAIDFPKKLKVSSTDESSLCFVVKEIIDQFKHLVENHGIYKLLWKDKGTPNHENVSQMLFFSVALSYCKANDIDINPEIDAGVGRIDFKFSNGYSKKAIIVIKHSYNQNIIPGFETQLELYKKAEETCHGFYVVIDVGRMGNKYDQLIKKYNNSDRKADLFYIDGKIKKSASKRKSQ